MCLSSSARSGVRLVREGLGPEVDADRAQKVPLVDRAIDGRPGRAAAARHGGEIDMGGEIAIPRRGERVGVAVRAQGLERVAEPGDRMSVIDEERRAALLHQPCAEFEHEAVARRIDLQDLAVRRIRLEVRLGRRGDVEGEIAVAVEAHDPLPPLAADPHELPHRQRVEELVGDDDCGTRGNLAEFLRPGDGDAAVEQKLVLHRRQRRARLDEPDVERGAEFRDDPGRAQRIAHQRAPARPDLDQMDRARRTHARPHFRRPQAEKLAEHLRDFRGGGEVAARAERIAVHVIAELGMGERERHVAFDRDRTVPADQRLDFVEQGRHLSSTSG